MKTMRCNQLGGPCETEFSANTFEEMMEMSKNHGMEMYQKGDAAHIKVMSEMKESMKTQTPESMQAWIEEKKKMFDNLPND